jgi:hypothetical protein
MLREILACGENRLVISARAGTTGLFFVRLALLGGKAGGGS